MPSINVPLARVRHTSTQMLRNRTGTNAALAATVASISRTTSWQLIDELPLRFNSYHPQGMARVGSMWWISTVDIETCRGLVLGVDSDGNLVEQVEVGDSWRYHPGGMDFDGSAFWIPCAEYRPDSSTAVYRLQPGEAPHHAFDVDDHIGAMARCGPDGDLVGWSWGSRRFYQWSVEGHLQNVRVNPGFFVDHQDCQWLDTGHLLCGGVAELGLSTGPGWLGGLGLLNVDSMLMEREVPFPIYSSASGRVATHNPLWAETRNGQLIVHLLPDDGISAILSYATPILDATPSVDLSASERLEPVGASITSS